jgi:hypothetical protein
MTDAKYLYRNDFYLLRNSNLHITLYIRKALN